MRNLILFLTLLFSSVSFGQNIESLLDSTQIKSIQSNGYYVNSIDPIDKRIDTLISKYYKIRITDTRVFEDNIIIFYELENLLVIINSFGEKKFYFLNFSFELVSEAYINKHFSSEIGDDIIINYSKYNHSTKEFDRPYISHIVIHPSNKNNYSYVFF